MRTDYGDWLLERMRVAAIGRNELARRAGVNATTITHATRHGRIPTAATIVALARALNADPGEALEVAGLIRLSDLPADVTLELRGLSRRLWQLSGDQRRRVLAQWSLLLDLVSPVADEGSR